jgi:predicted AAA+ superfamily ATPase
MTGDEFYNSQSDKSWLGEFLENGSIPQRVSRFLHTDSLSHFLWRGTMPGLINAPDSMVAPYFDSYIQTYIERDVRMQEDIKNISDFGRFVRLCSSLTAQKINSSQIGREIGVTPQTARRCLDLLIHSFQWIEIEPFSGNTIKRISGKKKGYLTDTGLAAYLQRISSPDALMGTGFFGALFETYAVNSIIKTVSLMTMKPGIYHWRTAGGAETDLVLDYNGKLFPVEIKAKTNLSMHDAGGIGAFFKTYPERSKTGVIIYAGSEVYQVKENIWAVPWDAI